MPSRIRDGGITVVAYTDLEAGTRVKPLPSGSIPATDTTGLMYIQKVTNRNDAWCGTVPKDVAANTICTLWPTFNGLHLMKVKIDPTGTGKVCRTGGYVYVLDDEYFTTTRGTGQNPVGMIITPYLNVATTGSIQYVMAQGLLSRWFFDS
jgi:hypothetical protein